MSDKEKNVNYEEMDEDATIEAAADSVTQETVEDLTKISERLTYIVKLSKTYNWDGQEIKEVDLSRLEELTTMDGEYIDRVMSKMNHHPKDKFRDLVYTKHIAMRVTNLPVEFFNGLSWKDQQAITARITLYFFF